MPKIEVNEKLFFNLLGTKYDYDTLEKKLTCGKAELDEKPDMSQGEDERVIKIELNDTNRPDLWSTGGVARCLRLHGGAKRSDYSSFMSKEGAIKDCGDRIAYVDESIKEVRPFMVSFVISGKPIDDPMLKDIIQTQEKLCWNFGRKRKTISMGVYRSAQIKWPVHYKGVNPDETSFVPLGCDAPMTCRQILSDHPKGKDFGWILKDAKKFPLLTDDNGEVMSMAPIINSATLGAVQVGDKDLMVELTGDNMENLILSANIVACDFHDAGYEILPVKVVHPYETALCPALACAHANAALRAVLPTPPLPVTKSARCGQRSLIARHLHRATEHAWRTFRARLKRAATPGPASRRRLEKHVERLLIGRGEVVVVELFLGHPAMVVHAQVGNLGRGELTSIDAEVDVVVRVGVLDVQDALVNDRLDAHQFAQLTPERRLFGLSGLDLASGKLPEQRQHGFWGTLGDQVAAIPNDERADDGLGGAHGKLLRQRAERGKAPLGAWRARQIRARRPLQKSGAPRLRTPRPECVRSARSSQRRRYWLTMLNSVRRLSARPLAVLFGAMGFSGPKPMASSRSGSMPFFTM